MYLVDPRIITDPHDKFLLTLSVHGEMRFC